MSRALSVKTSVFLRRTCHEQKYFVAKIKVAMEAPGTEQVRLETSKNTLSPANKQMTSLFSNEKLQPPNFLASPSWVGLVLRVPLFAGFEGHPKPTILKVPLKRTRPCWIPQLQTKARRAPPPAGIHAEVRFSTADMR